MGHLCGALTQAYRVLVFEHAAGGDEVFRDLVLARIIEPTSKLDSLRVLQEVGIDPPAYRTLTRRLRVFATDSWREKGGCGVRGTNAFRIGEPGGLRRFHVVFRNRYR